LQELSIIGTEIISLDGIETVAGSLQVLRVICCGIKKIDGCILKMSGLKELYLQENKIAAIDNLSGCKILEKLWLQSNKISKIENLHHNVGIVELSLADNSIQVIENVKSLVHLEVLDMSQNPIENLQDIKEIETLTTLRVISFGSLDYEPCPVCNVNGYKQFIMATLASTPLEVTYVIKKLDGLAIKQDELKGSRTEYMKQVMQYQKAIKEIEAQQFSHRFTRLLGAIGLFK
jgi:Leucine-rich repeat (LRR) protein